MLQENLNKVLVFNKLDPALQRKVVSEMYERSVPAGEILIKEGDSGLAASELYVVKSGKFEVRGRAACQQKDLASLLQVHTESSCWCSRQDVNAVACATVHTGGTHNASTLVAFNFGLGRSAGAAAAARRQLPRQPQGAGRRLWGVGAHVQLCALSHGSSDHRGSCLGAGERRVQVRALSVFLAGIRSDRGIGCACSKIALVCTHARASVPLSGT